MGTSAQDCAILFDTIAKYDPRDPNSIAGPPTRNTSALITGPRGRDPLSLQGLTFGIPQDFFVSRRDPQVRNA